tara:strand:+ start:3886 stop:4935 length:1050 start_codon:yes stop_codon:yes gene_type:complete
MTDSKPIIGISVGDLNGIGMEIIIKTFQNPDILSICTPVVFASSKVASFHRKALKIENFSFNIVHEIDKIAPKKANLLNCWKDDVNIRFGIEDSQVGKYALRSLEKACEFLEEGKIDALVTAPINKAAIQSENFKFSGHTDYLEARFGAKATMMLISDHMRMALATVHIPISKVAVAINEELILKRLESIRNSLKSDFNISKGKIAVLGLNPHAGDKGVIGKEEQEIIGPAIQKAFDKGIMAFGPYSADSFFGSDAYTKFDAILSMYHDQGLIPFKGISFGQGVNYSAGLPIVRTSPDHGTGFDIAGKGLADETSFRQAVYMALEIARNRKENFQLEKNALKKQRKQDH